MKRFVKEYACYMSALIPHKKQKFMHIVELHKRGYIGAHEAIQAIERQIEK